MALGVLATLRVGVVRTSSRLYCRRPLLLVLAVRRRIFVIRSLLLPRSERLGEDWCGIVGAGPFAHRSDVLPSVEVAVFARGRLPTLLGGCGRYLGCSDRERRLGHLHRGVLQRGLVLARVYGFPNKPLALARLLPERGASWLVLPYLSRTRSSARKGYSRDVPSDHLAR